MYEAWLATEPGDADRFWRLTPRTYLVEMLAYHDRARARRESSISQAWLTALLTRADQLPDLDSLINPPPPPPVEEVIRTLRVEAPRRSWDEWLAR